MQRDPGQPSPAYWVFSWSSRSGLRHYALVPEVEKHAFIVTFNRSLPGMPILAELEARLRTLPEGELVGFCDNRVGITIRTTISWRASSKSPRRTTFG